MIIQPSNQKGKGVFHYGGEKTSEVCQQAVSPAASLVPNAQQPGESNILTSEVSLTVNLPQN